jgi:hypothetical protein
MLKRIKQKLEVNDICIFSHQGNIYIHGNTDLVEEDDLQLIREQKSEFLRLLENTPLMFEMNACQRSMVLEEIFKDNRKINSSFILLNPNRVVGFEDMRKVLSKLYEKYPLLASKVVINGDKFLFKICEKNELPELQIDPKHYDSKSEFAAKFSEYEKSVFDPALMHIFGAYVDEKIQWGIWTHHIVTDAPFMSEFLLSVYHCIEGEIDTTPDFGFLEQNWYINRLANDVYEDASVYWAKKASDFSKNILQPEEFDFSKEFHERKWKIPKCVGKKIASSLNYSKISSIAFFGLVIANALGDTYPGRVLHALTTFSLRKISSSKPCAGFYTNLLPLSLNTTQNSEPIMGSTLCQLNEDIQSAFDYGWIPYEQICEWVGVKRESVCLIINLIRFEEVINEIPNNYFEAAGPGKSRTPLKLTVIENSDGPFELIVSGTVSHKILDLISNNFEKIVTGKLLEKELDAKSSITS